MMMRPLLGLLHVRGLVSGQRITRAVVSMPIFLAVTVNLGQQGTVKISGNGLRTTTKRGLKAGTRTITVSLTAVGRAAKRHKSKLKIQATLTVSGRTGTATTTLRA